ncbi:MAG: LytTR family DNA-binding domain-containing protein [Lactobacillus sp.]|jgi:two-component system response regulator AgrA|nr:LytTR family DNA-binding domain-containing protein [Lactobacillus sp.]MCI2032884.1 LytTR family DNA-binding domain-containing protein [Lactobacillus sp.]
MKIFLLEDDKLQRKRMKALIEALIIQIQAPVTEIFDTGSADTLLEQVRANSNRGTQMLYFLDIELKDALKQDNQPRKGLEVASEIRQLDRFASIVFVTTHSEFAPITYAYKVSALQFIAKDQPEKNFSQQLQSCIEYVADSDLQPAPDDVYEFETEYTHVQIPFIDLLYFETLSQPHKVAVVTPTQRIEFYSNLKQIEASDPRLVRCHKSFVVNVCNIARIDRANSLLTLRGGATCYLARRKIKIVEERRRAYGGQP